jgi:hypothetical protein
MRGGEGGCGVSAKKFSCTHGAQINFGDLTPYLTYGSICPYVTEDIILVQNVVLLDMTISREK